MSKTFKSALIQYGDRTLTVKEHAGHVNVTVRDPETTFGATVPSTDAPALALAILEAAGIKSSFHADPAYGTSEQLEHIVHELNEFTQEVKLLSKWAADRKALEAEAWELFKACHPETTGTSLEPGFTSYDIWTSVARKARELHGGTK